MRLDHPLSRRQRAQGARWAVALLMGLLGVAFFRAQVVRSSAWALQSDSNRLRALPLPAPRGAIFDRRGRVLADNVPGYSILLLPAPRDSVAATLRRMAPHLGLSEAGVEALLERFRSNPRQPLVVKAHAAFPELSAVEERRLEFPSLYVEMRPRRRYVAGAATAHVLGYLGEITSAELESPNFRGYERGAVVGKDGVERQYENLLQGVAGVRYVEVDALGRIVGSFRGTSRVPPRPGHDLVLNLDLDLQEWIHHIFPDSMRGAVVALNVEDGGILALYSSPTYDPNAFVGGISPENWRALSEDPGQPLFNRAVLGRYPPGSTWKLATAAIGLELGVVSPEEFMPIPCTGAMSFGNRTWRCWAPEGHGFQNLVGAVRHSCDVYFYQLGLRIGLERLIHEATAVGFNQPCGVDLPAERAGEFPTDVSWWQRTFGYRATEGEVLSLAIGQGPNSQTPLKMAQFYVALARDGTAPPPRLLRSPAVPLPHSEWSLRLSPRALEALRKGLRAVVAPGGTAHLASLEHWDLLGKTGTSQNPPHPDHAWFAGMAGPPGRPPEIVVVAIVEFGESGSRTAAPLVAKTADYYLRRKYGIPVDTIQTLGEHLRAGRPAPWASRPGQG